eukprot:CAMPEP_0118908674 /NCGR_PEP_ID=MMETSP1166-20130328/11581_1 /TAXON_ID=1104430 /ORGANISM="Chrysoreinhardia sp, Strain CCMP3193" /LENGTH=164 /DNA_ID=CAMNT_0006848071 /DNA_START=1053 /DNA_END=1544 /DNA_ORIENTATION=-
MGARRSCRSSSSVFRQIRPSEEGAVGGVALAVADGESRVAERESPEGVLELGGQGDGLDEARVVVVEAPRVDRGGGGFGEGGPRAGDADGAEEVRRETRRRRLEALVEGRRLCRAVGRAGEGRRAGGAEVVEGRARRRRGRGAEAVLEDPCRGRRAALLDGLRR